MRSLRIKLGLSFVVMLITIGFLALGFTRLVEIHERESSEIQNDLVPRIRELQKVGRACEELSLATHAVSMAPDERALALATRRVEISLETLLRHLDLVLAGDPDRDAIGHELQSSILESVRLRRELLLQLSQVDPEALISAGIRLAESLELELILLAESDRVAESSLRETERNVLGLVANLEWVQAIRDPDRVEQLRQDALLDLRPMSARLAEMPSEHTEPLRAFLSSLLVELTTDAGIYGARLRTLELEAELAERESDVVRRTVRLENWARRSFEAVPVELAAVHESRKIGIDRLRNRLLLQLGVLAIAVLAVGSYVEFRVSRRLRSLANDVERLAEGELDISIPAGGDAELAAIARAAEVFRRNALRLSETSEELAARNQALDEFAHVAAHDLKSPLRGIDQLASWVEEDAGEQLPAESRHHLATLRERASSMKSLLDQLLAFSRLGNRDGARSRFDLGEAIDRVLARIDLPPNGRVAVSLEDQLPPVELPRASIDLLLTNLVQNAILHHDRDDPRVQIEVHRTGDTLELAVEDDGPGIAEDRREAAFQMFRRLATRSEGHGMGLAFVRRAAETLGGSCTLASASGERGVRFTVRLPDAFLDDGMAADARSGADAPRLAG